MFAAYLHSASAHEIAELRLGKKTEQLYAQAEKLHKQLDRYAYGPPQIRFTDDGRRPGARRRRADRVRAPAGRSSSTARCTASWSRRAIKRTHDELEAKAAAAAPRRRQTARAGQDSRPTR